MHFGWNLAESGVFGTAMSGFASRGLLRCTFDGPEWLTGGRFGLEAGLPALVVCTVAAGVLWKLYRRKAALAAPGLTPAVRRRMGTPVVECS